MQSCASTGAPAKPGDALYGSNGEQSVGNLVNVVHSAKDTAAALLVAVATATAINVSMFEVPVAMAVRAGADPEETLQTRLREYGLKQYPGYVAGAFTFLLIT